MTIEPIFNSKITQQQAANTEVVSSYFVDTLLSTRQHLTPQEAHRDAQKILYFFDRMNIPAPENHDEFINGSEGNIILSNQLGLVIRIEQKHPKEGNRINNNGYILKPISFIETDQTIIELCPTIKICRNQDMVYPLKETLKKTGINYHDESLENTGTIPVQTKLFPNGIICVMDRLAVKHTSIYSNKKECSLEKAAQKIQDKLYSPLRKAFKKAWGNQNKTNNFFSLCKKFKKQKKLITDWNCTNPWNSKTTEAGKSAKQYDLRMAA